MAEIDVFEIDLDKLQPGALKQLVQEVRNEDAFQHTRAYDRVHNRHNRGRGGERVPYYKPPPKRDPPPEPDPPPKSDPPPEPDPLPKRDPPPEPDPDEEKGKA